MKEKIIIFTLGLLSGAIIATGAIFVYTLADNNSSDNTSQMGGGEIPTDQGGQAPTDQGGQAPTGQGGQAPTGQGGTGTGDSTTPPEKPSDNGQTNVQSN